MTPEHFHAFQEGSLPGRYGLRISLIAEGRLEAAMEVQPWMHAPNGYLQHAPNGYLHAASVILLADSCAGFATMAHLPEGAKNFTTIELKSNFLGTAKEGVIRCEAVAEHLGRATQVWAATVFSPQGKKMALFRCTQMILS
jgi:1,4-dihydroxy-2-naphthoyl-CoA hydrolase